MIVFDGDFPIFAGLAREGEDRIVTAFGFLTLDVLHVHRFQRRQSVGFVGPGVFIRPHPNAVEVHQTDDQRSHGIERHGVVFNVHGHLLSQARQLRGKIRHIVVFHLGGDVGPVRMVPILQPALYVTTGGLDVTPWVWTNPNVHPSGRQTKRIPSRNAVFFLDGVAVRGTVQPKHLTLFFCDVLSRNAFERGVAADERCSTQRLICIHRHTALARSTGHELRGKNQSNMSGPMPTETVPFS